MGARKNHGSCLGLVLLSLGFQPSTRPHVGHSVGLAFPSRPPGRTALLSTAPQVCQPLTSGEVVRSPRRNPALSSETTIAMQLHRRSPHLPPSPWAWPPSSVLTFPKRCLTGFVLTVFMDACRACLGSVIFFHFCFFLSEQTGLNSHPLT